MSNADMVPVLIEFGAMESDDGTEHTPFISVTVDGEEPIHFYCNHVFETDDGAEACLDIVERALRSENISSH